MTLRYGQSYRLVRFDDPASMWVGIIRWWPVSREVDFGPPPRMPGDPSIIVPPIGWRAAKRAMGT